MFNRNNESLIIQTSIKREDLIGALIQGHYWKKKSENNEISIEDRLNESKMRFINRMMNTTYLSPEIQKNILQGNQPQILRISDLTNNLPLCWKEQKDKLGF